MPRLLWDKVLLYLKGKAKVPYKGRGASFKYSTGALLTGAVYNGGYKLAFQGQSARVWILALPPADSMTLGKFLSISVSRF